MPVPARRRNTVSGCSGRRPRAWRWIRGCRVQGAGLGDCKLSAVAFRRCRVEGSGLDDRKLSAVGTRSQTIQIPERTRCAAPLGVLGTQTSCALRVRVKTPSHLETHDFEFGLRPRRRANSCRSRSTASRPHPNSELLTTESRAESWRCEGVLTPTSGSWRHKLTSE